MDTFGKTAWIALLAGLLLLPLGGCTKTPSGQFETYNELKKTSGNTAAESERSETADAAPPLTSTPSPASVAAKPAESAKPSTAPVAQATQSAPISSGAQAAKEGTAAPVAAAYHASVASPVSKPAVAAIPAAGSSRKVQVLIPFRDFKPEGQDGAVRVTYDDIDLLKVLNMDPVTADAATKMPAWLKNLEGRRIRIRGFMYPTFQQTGVHAFGLARDNQICCFGRNPKIYDVFDVLLRDGVTTNYLPNRPFDVVGVFHIRPEADNGKLFRLYEMDDATVVIK
jgi:hypothetical protein